MTSQTLVQLIYTSRLMFDASTATGWTRIEDIVARARERNSAAQITGFLVVGKDWVAQVIEGPREAVNTTFRRILQDTRHTDVKLIDLRIVAKRSFSCWAMGASRRPLAEIPPELIAGPVGFTPYSFESILSVAQVEAA